MIGTILDIETTGYLKFDVDSSGYSVLSDNSEILEVGFINVDMTTCRPLTHGTLYFYKPYFNVESDSQRVHKLTRDFLQQYEDKFTENLIALNALMQHAIIIGKNSEKFDIPFIEAFIKKHGGDKFDIPALVLTADMKAYHGGHVTYDKDVGSIDMQQIYKQRFHDLYAQKYGVILGAGVDFDDSISKFESGLGVKLNAEQITTLHDTHSRFIEVHHMDRVYPIPEKPMLSNQKKGTLTEYVEVIPGGYKAVQEFYANLTKDRTTGAHGALYDAVATYLVWLDAKINKLC